MSDGNFEFYIGEVSNMEATVFVRYEPSIDVERPIQDQVTLRGTLHGPFCDVARTLPAEFTFRDLAPRQPGVAKAVVTDPCIWTEELPHVYHLIVEAINNDSVIDKLQDTIAIRALK